jgi:hypothetical protein
MAFHEPSILINELADFVVRIDDFIIADLTDEIISIVRLNGRTRQSAVRAAL